MKTTISIETPALPALKVFPAAEVLAAVVALDAPAGNDQNSGPQWAWQPPPRAYQAAKIAKKNARRL